MSTPSADWPALLGLAILLGIRHGFDADHLATIDGLTRVNLRNGRPFARLSGALFALGHGAVVVLIAALAGFLATRWQTPSWLEASAAAISVFFLTTLGVLNLLAVLNTRPNEPVPLVGLRSAWVARLRGARPWTIMAVGALFAVSFDTVNQAALFALGAAQLGGVGHGVLLGLAFTGGMLLTDGLNGLWISDLIRRADRFAITSSRVLSLSIALISLTLAAFCASKFAWHPVADWAEGKELTLGIGVVMLTLAAFLGGKFLARRREVPVGTRT
ncbi:MAG TPA: nickel transporter [Steroidobacteraceae bacterium]